MKVRLICVPYDSGRFMAGLGLGPVAVVQAGLGKRLADAGHDVRETTLLLAGRGTREVGSGFAVAARLAEMCRDAVVAEEFPLVLAGNCFSSVGVCAGIGADAIVWADAHADLNTPETTTSGFLDGMALATALGLAWPGMTAQVPGFSPPAPERVVLVDARDLDPPEAELIAARGIRRVELAGAVDAARALAQAGARRSYLHLDLDVHDPTDLAVNPFAVAGGPGRDALRQTVASLPAALPIAGASITAFDPHLGPEGAVIEATVELAVTLVNAVAEGRVMQALNSAIRL